MDSERTGGASSTADAENLAFDVFARACPSRGTLEHVTGKWGGLILGALHEGTFRFNELRRRVDGVSEKMLSQTLHALERDGLVHREAQPTNPPRVDYRLTPLGSAVAERLLALIYLVEDRMPEVLTAQERYDTGRAGSGGAAAARDAGRTAVAGRGGR
ncbi:helix-turn-helix transcriptional regulator [Streptomyces samsunensis]|uniref:Helix-turn-helix transcriptional regulator n=1 Tax=Streptomyces malaysiensis TaxID=92644 RepID=A0ABX6WBH7_STRMQ|nr:MULTISPECIES: helix-turn-helix domain-containing protein [Streptomyces]ATL85769.1 transcriptional regulator [Streptomyces malaysiensis]MCD9595087.1 helix-turn-helix transcriptional regulator [Streptomyces sp. 8ZJF_21]MCM3807586.1 helix-turn-helix transcriptional regulator [Streptomyces sp. DR7-3]MCQ6251672.1 helix-turn-helix transcriptional regulator [Streptomyces malaysiensis]NUH43722.1 helix-turn-helix transcriptional regulator [Streptomyces samsunensis]